MSQPGSPVSVFLDTDDYTIVVTDAGCGSDGNLITIRVCLTSPLMRALNKQNPDQGEYVWCMDVAVRADLHDEPKSEIVQIIIRVSVMFCRNGTRARVGAEFTEQRSLSAVSGIRAENKVVPGLDIHFLLKLFSLYFLNNS